MTGKWEGGDTKISFDSFTCVPEVTVSLLMDRDGRYGHYPIRILPKFKYESKGQPGFARKWQFDLIVQLPET